MRATVAFALLLAACADPPPPSEAPPITAATEDGVRVTVGGREVVVHCVLTCPATETELARLSSDCLASPASGPHRVAPGGPMLTLGCCEEANLAYDRACGREGLPGCAQAWTARCEGVAPHPERALAPDDRGVTTERGLGH